jgi:methyl-accepting chemotaxis protein
LETVVGNGGSSKRDTAAAATEAAQRAHTMLGNCAARFGFVFAGPNHDLRLALSVVAEIAQGADIVASTTAGEFTEAGLLHNGLVVMLVGAEGGSHAVAIAEGLRGNCWKVAEDLSRAVPDKSVRGKGNRHLTTVLLTDGLAGSGEELVLRMFERSSATSQMVGGAAADESAFQKTVVGAGTNTASDAAAVLHVFGCKPWGIGVNHGLRPTSKPMRVTRANANVIYEIDGVPAFEVYRRHALERRIQLTPENAGAYMVGNELGVLFFDKVTRARAPLSVDTDGSLRCAAGVPEGAFVSILDGQPASMVQAARSAAEEARDRLGQGRAAGVLLFDCVCRGMILKDKFYQEIDAVRSVFGDVPVTGFLTYGEIAKYAGRLDGWHNATAVVAAIPA